MNIASDKKFSISTFRSMYKSCVVISSTLNVFAVLDAYKCIQIVNAYIQFFFSIVPTFSIIHILTILLMATFFYEILVAFLQHHKKFGWYLLSERSKFCFQVHSFY
jgi:hypothetical protein